MHNDSLNPALKLSLIQLLPWRWPLNGSIPPAFPQRPPWPHHTIQGEQNKCSCKRKGQFTVPAPHPCVADFLAYFKIQKNLMCPALKINRCNRLCEVCQASFRALILKHLKGKRAHHCLRTQLAASRRCFEMPQVALSLRRVSFIILLLLCFVRACTVCSAEQLQDSCRQMKRISFYSY